MVVFSGNSQEFFSSVNEGYWLIKFFADWCQPCQETTETFWRYANNSTFNGIEVDVEENPDIAMHFNVETLPTVIALQNGSESDRVVGIFSYSSLTQKLSEST